MLSCNGGVEVEKCPKPHVIPEWVEWDCIKHKAYSEGRVYFNEDSTAFGIGSGDTLSEENQKFLKEKLKTLGNDTTN